MAHVCDMCGKVFSEDYVLAKDGKCRECWRKLFPPEPAPVKTPIVKIWPAKWPVKRTWIDYASGDDEDDD